MGGLLKLALKRRADSPSKRYLLPSFSSAVVQSLRLKACVSPAWPVRLEGPGRKWWRLKGFPDGCYVPLVVNLGSPVMLCSKFESFVYGVD